MFAFLLSGCKDEGIEPEPPTMPDKESSAMPGKAARTVLVYMVADNNLSMYSNGDIYEMLYGKVDMGVNDHLILYLDDYSLPRIYDITSRTVATSLSGMTPVFSYTEEKNSCTYEQFASVLQYVKEHYLSDSYGLVLWSHASGWIPPTVSDANNRDAYGTKTRSFGQDRNPNSATEKMSIDDLRDALYDFGLFDYIFFDACFMQNIEVLYQLRNTAKYIVASPAEIPGPGAPYHLIMKSMFAEQGYAEGIVNGYYNGYVRDSQYGVLLSAVDTQMLEWFAEFMRPYVIQYKQSLMNMQYDTVQDYYLFDMNYKDNGYPDYYDMKGIMLHALSEDDYLVWQKEYERIFAAAVHTPWWYSAIMSQHYPTVDDAQYSGVSMHIPLKKYADRNAWFAAGYYDTDWAQAVWTE